MGRVRRVQDRCDPGGPDAAAVKDPFDRVRLAFDALNQCRVGSNWRTTGIAATGRTRSTSCRGTCTPAANWSASARSTESTICSPAISTTRTSIRPRASTSGGSKPTARRTRSRGRELMSNLIANLSSGVSKSPVEFARLGRTLKKRSADVLAYVDAPGPATAR